jgi:diadenosine tetraphosphate (Ap4A) HIT family hydrolase
VTTLFTKIIDGELPGRFVWKDDRAVAFMSIAPLKPGHVLVVPRDEVDHWLDLPPELMQHLSFVSQQVGRAIQSGFQPERVGTMILGLEVPHVHIHVVPIWGVNDLDFANADSNARGEDIEAAAGVIRRELRSMGRSEVV